MSDFDLNTSSTKTLALLRSQDPALMEKLVRAYTGDLYRASLGLGFGHEMSPDLVQGVWVTFFDAVKNFEGKSHIRTFLFGILYNKAQELRRELSRARPDDAIEDIVDERFDAAGNWIKPPLDPERFLIATQTMKLIEECLEALPTNQRAAFYMREVEERESHEICGILGVTLTNFGVLLFRARNRLRECIERKSA